MDDWQYADLIERALAAMANGDHVRALALADQAVARRSDDAAVRNLRAQALLNMGSGAEALDEAEEAVRLEPDQPEAHLVMATAAWEAGRLELAQRSFEYGLKLSGREPELLARFAWFMACERGPRPAGEAAEEALRADPASVLARAAMALVQLRRHEYAAAEEMVHEAEAIDPGDVHTQSVHLALLEQQGRTAEAERLARRLAGQPGTQELVESVLRDVKQRRLSRLVVERFGGRAGQPTRHSGWAIVLTMFGLSLITLAVAVAMFPMLRWEAALAGLACLTVPFVLLLIWFRD